MKKREISFLKLHTKTNKQGYIPPPSGGVIQMVIYTGYGILIYIIILRYSEGKRVV